MGQLWGGGLSRELDPDDAEGPQAGDSTAGLCLTQPMVITWVGNPARVSRLPLMSPFPVPSLSRDAFPLFCSSSGTSRPMSFTAVAPFWGWGWLGMSQYYTRKRP